MRCVSGSWGRQRQQGEMSLLRPLQTALLRYLICKDKEDAGSTIVCSHKRITEMKHALLRSVLAVLLLAGCQYEFPLSPEHNISIASAVLGLWEPIPDEGKRTKQNERLMILRFFRLRILDSLPRWKRRIVLSGLPHQGRRYTVRPVAGHWNQRWTSPRRREKAFPPGVVSAGGR